MKIVSLPWREMNEQYEDLAPDDVVIVPAFGAPISFMDKVESQGCHTVDTTCGDVMKVWKRVRGFALMASLPLFMEKQITKKPGDRLARCGR